MLALVRRHGRTTTSFQVLEPGLRFWFDRDAAPDAPPRGAVAFADVGGAWVVAGAPIAPPERVWEVGERFAAAAVAAGRRVVFVCVERWAREPAARRWLRALAIGRQPVWVPGDWPATLAASRGLREQLRRARAKGVAVRAVPPAEMADAASPSRLASEALVRRWLTGRRMAPMGFLVELHPFEHAEERRFFLAERGGDVVGFLAAVPVHGREGWLIEDFLRAPAAPNGTMELLFAVAIEALGGEGAAHVTMGLAPLAGVGGALGLLRRASRPLYDFDGLRAFKAKLRPAAWEPVYLAWPRAQGEGAVAATRALLDTLRAFARGSLVRFAAATLVHRRRAVAGVLAALLVPWTALLATADPRWFPSRGVRAAWVLFDVAVAAVLGLLARRWRPRLAAVLAALVSLDAATTAVEAALWNLPRRRSALDAVVVAVSLAAPTFAAWFLARAARRRGEDLGTAV